MRASSRFLARFLEPGTPTGLTGLFTHATPRSTLLSLYDKTLVNLRSLPDTSVYRQSVEALTRHRLALVSATAPDTTKTTTSPTAKLPQEHSRIAPQYGDTEIILAVWTRTGGWKLEPIAEASAYVAGVTQEYQDWRV